MDRRFYESLKLVYGSSFSVDFYRADFNNFIRRLITVFPTGSFEVEDDVIHTKGYLGMMELGHREETLSENGKLRDELLKLS